MGYLPTPFKIENRYYYDPFLLKLKNDEGPELYNAAKTEVILKNDLSNSSDATSKIDEAITFLEQVKNSERAKEEACITYYLDLLEKQLSVTENEELKKIYQDLKKNIEALDPKSLEENQARLIHQMSIIRSKPELYQKRLQKLITQMPKDWKLEKAQQEDFLIGNQSFIESIIKLDSSQYEQNLYNQIQEYINTYVPTEINLSHNTSLVASIAADFRAFLQENNKNLVLGENNLQLFNDYKKQKRYLLNLINQSDNITQEEQINENYTTLLTVLEDMEKELGIMSFSEAEELKSQLKQEKIQLENRQKKAKRESTKKKLQNKIDAIDRQIDRIVEGKNNTFFRLHTKTSHGDIQEVITTLIYRALSVPGSAAVDHIGSITIDTRINNIFPIFQKISQEMQDITNMRIENHTDLKTYSDNYKNKNLAIQNILKDYQKNISESIPDFTKMFITNESAKLYWNAENRTQDFSGREIGIADALAQLYSIDESFLVEQNNLIHIIINLSSATKNQKPTLENYLSIFSGLLMFGDIYNMAVEAAKFAETNLISKDIHVIHLYNIGETFVPSSIVLENICNNFKDINSKIDPRMAARATITSYAPKIKKKYNSTKSDWEQASNDALLNTKIKLHFLKGLFNFIKNYNLLG